MANAKRITEEWLAVRVARVKGCAVVMPPEDAEFPDAFFEIDGDLVDVEVVQANRSSDVRAKFERDRRQAEVLDRAGTPAIAMMVGDAGSAIGLLESEALLGGSYDPVALVLGAVNRKLAKSYSTARKTVLVVELQWPVYDWTSYATSIDQVLHQRAVRFREVWVCDLRSTEPATQVFPLS